MNVRKRLSHVEALSGYRRHQPSDADPFWASIRRQIGLLDRDDLEGALAIDIVTDGILRRRDPAECRRASTLLLRSAAGMERLGGTDDGD